MRHRLSVSRRLDRARAWSRPRVVVAALWALILTIVTGAPVAAYWTDQVTATSGGWTSGTVPAFGPMACANDGTTQIAVSWPNPGSRFDYQATLVRADTQAQVGSAVTLAAGGSEATVVRALAPTTFASAATLQATGQQNFVVRVQARLTSNTAWTSNTATAAVHVESAATVLRCGFVADTSTFVTITAMSTDSGQSASDWITNQPTQIISGTGEPGATVALTRGGTTLGTAAVAQNGTWSVPNVTLAEGLFTYTATATDAANNTATDTEAIRLDTIAPAVTQAASTCTLNGNQVTGQTAGTLWCRMTSRGWTMTATDTGGSGVAAREYTNAGSAWTAYSTTVSMAERSARVMQARATDVAGNVSPIATGTYWIDGTAPTLAYTYPTPGLSVAGSLLVQLIGTNCGTGSVGCGTITDVVSGPAAAGTYVLTRSALLSAPCFTGTGYSNSSPCPAQQVAISGGTWRALGTTSAAYPLGLLQTFTFVLNISDQAGNPASSTISWTALA
ncbi:Ig-like domain-containing protein [Microbacterium stercoris]|uniref:Bacterial Ig-like domain-containing protein n=1 Tax=Microbacterium stercoris TaxID=2820289 RepID=A0A939QTX6_9MICO|nr:Ig-like domain-containing protein [Microbacterium stercoris]MBO3665108.1 hypothetical protein [Microbacterium stercoris]